ncbi:AI-2E family transporter [Microbacterium foliorum]|uniref:AI-2E family transporter n=1 Tax=Microbacterium foliorum TaxID=104336 RepID=A0A4Y5YQL2_9MICO|nr:AI-2E family transporter [Microbacterium foliorum]QDE34816.1 AI-2E family transporter [Microbacterium foliorum]
MLTSSSGSSGRQRPAHSHILVTLACAVIILVGLHLARGLIAPLAVAVVVVIVCLPLGDAVLTRTRSRTVWLGTVSIVVVAFGVLAAAGALLWVAGSQLVQLFEDLAPGGALDNLAPTLYEWVMSFPGAAPELSVIPSLDLAASVSIVREIGASVGGTAVALFLVCAYVVVAAADAGRYRRARQLFGAAASGRLERISNLNSAIRRYYLVNSVFGAIVATIDGLALWSLGVPAPVLWAVLAFVTNFIPTVGFVIGLAPPALLALAVGGWQLFLAVVVIYCFVNVTLQVFVQPKFVSDAVGLSLTISFFSVFFWTFVLGPIGAILAIPLTLATRAILLEGKPQEVWLLWLSGQDNTSRLRPRVRKMPWKQHGHERSR